jgi:saccharopine dehydrogenase-like NADP-dependent oxidoreductase
MTRIVVLGGCGGIGSVAAATLAVSDDVDELVLADVRADVVAAAAAGYGRPGVTGVAVDATDSASVAAVLEGADLVVNCIGPFYRFGAPLLAAAISAGVTYVDVCDDLDATRAQLELDGMAKAAGVCALIGMGNSPGFANVLVRYAADHLLDAVESVDIMHIHGGEPTEGPAVIKHRIHAMTNDVPLFIDGEFRTVRMLEPDGQAFVVDTDFRDVGTYPVYPYPHPETITLPRYLPGLRRATNLGVVFPLSYFDMTMDMVRLGAAGTEPVTVDGAEVVPLEFTVSHILAQRQRLLDEAGITGAAGCLKIVVSGTRNDAPGTHTVVFSLSSGTMGAGEGTGIPAGLGALMLLAGHGRTPGVHPPEAIVDPLVMLGLANDVLPLLALGATDGDPDGGRDGAASAGMVEVPIHIAHHLPDGSVDELSLGLG